MPDADQCGSTSGATDETIDSFVREAASAPPREPERIPATIGRFRVLDRLGAGGMGVVYKALDDTLGRALALKVLPRDVVNDAERVRRFELEARAASALSHPNIVTIYEMGRVPPDVYYLAMELIDGDSLRAAMAARRSFAALSDVLVQVATGLAKAHAAGIVHRDLKPENIMVTRDGFAKILDFGLAKLLRPPTLLHHKGDGAPFSETESGVVLGTVGYMSPEQVRGEAVDHRTDVFAFGCILFEAATGQRPFRGSTSIDTLHAILHAPTPALNDQGSIHPPELDRIVARCLAKDPNARYDSMRDVAHDLRALATTAGGSPSLVSERSEVVSAPVRPSPRLRWPFVVTTLALVAAIVWLAFDRFSKPEPSAQPGPRPHVQMESITQRGDVAGAGRFAISPDGKYVAFVTREKLKYSLWLRQTQASAEVRVVGGQEALHNIFFAPGGDSLYFISPREVTELNGTLFRIPTLGGAPTQVLDEVHDASLSWDGKRLAFVRASRAPRETRIFVSPSDGTEPRLVTKAAGELLGNIAWSHDGRHLAAVRSHNADSSNSLVEIDVSSGAVSPIGKSRWSFIATSIAWSSDDRSILFSAPEAAWQNRVLRIDRASGRVTRLTEDTSSYVGVRLTADGSRLLTLKNSFRASLWVVPRANPLGARSVAAGLGRYFTVAWASDDRLVYDAHEGAAQNLFSIRKDGTDRKQLTAHPGESFAPSVSRAGRFIAFESNRTGASAIWRIDLDGGNPKQLTRGRGETSALATPDGRWVLFLAPGVEKGTQTLWKVESGGGDPIQLASEHAYGSEVSPDGRKVLFKYLDPNTRKSELAILPIEGGAKRQRVSTPKGAWMTRWTPDGRGIAYLRKGDNGATNVWAQPIEGAEPKQLTHFDSQFLINFAFSWDGAEIACIRGHSVRDLVLIRNIP
jgi:serine/threonine protein kinase/Tol biopolymer transport system component